MQLEFVSMLIDYFMPEPREILIRTLEEFQMCALLGFSEGKVLSTRQLEFNSEKFRNLSNHQSTCEECVNKLNSGGSLFHFVLTSRNQIL